MHIHMIYCVYNPYSQIVIKHSGDWRKEIFVIVNGTFFLFCSCISNLFVTDNESNFKKNLGSLSSTDKIKYSNLLI